MGISGNRGVERCETGERNLSLSPVSHLWLPRLVEIDSTWNPSFWSERLFERELENQNAQVEGLFAGEELIGYLIAHVICDEAHVVSFGIDPAWRGAGRGGFFLRSFLEKCERQGVAVVTLEVRASNHTAQRLYFAHGFKAVGIRKKYYSSNQEDAVTMRWSSQG